MCCVDYRDIFHMRAASFTLRCLDSVYHSSLHCMSTSSACTHHSLTFNIFCFIIFVTLWCCAVLASLKNTQGIFLNKGNKWIKTSSAASLRTLLSICLQMGSCPAASVVVKHHSSTSASAASCWWTFLQQRDHDLSSLRRSIILKRGKLESQLLILHWFSTLKAWHSGKATVAYTCTHLDHDLAKG